VLGGEEKELEYGTDAAAAAVAGQASFWAVGTCCWSCSSEFLLNLLDICLLQKDLLSEGVGFLGGRGMADRRRQSLSGTVQGLTRPREMGIGGEAERDLGFLQECCCSSHQQQQGRWSRRSSSSIQLLILLFWLHSLLYTLAFLSVAVEAEVPASPRYSLIALNNPQTPNAADVEQIPSSPPPPISSSSSSTGDGHSPTPDGIHPSPVHKSPASAPSGNPSPSPAPNHAPTTHINSTSGAAAPVSASPRFNSEEKTGIILAAFAALLQVVVVTYLLAKRRQMLGMVCDYDPPERSWENPAFSRS
jgi:hypothetical protein